MGSLTDKKTWSYKNVATNATTVVKATPGKLRGIMWNTKGASSNTLSLYDHASAASGNSLGVFDTTAVVQGTQVMDLSFSVGLVAVTATGTAVNCTFLYA